MNPHCTVCHHPQREAIDMALLVGVPVRDVASRAVPRLSKSAVQRHKAHIATTLTHAHAAAEALRADDLLAQVRDLQSRALTILERAEEAGDLRTALQAIREARGNLELLARMLGELQEGTEVNVLVAPEWVAVRQVVVEALGPYPAARQAVVTALEAMDHDHGP